MLGQLVARAGRAYRAKVGKELGSCGLLYEDLLVETEEVQLALSRLPKEVYEARQKRLMRAMILSSQNKRLPPEVYEKVDAFEPYLRPYLDEIEKSKEELMLAK